MHTSPLAQPGTGDGGGMNVYVRELSTALARAGVACDVYTRAVGPDQPPVVPVEPGLRVHHVPAGPLLPVPKELLPALVDEFTDAVIERLTAGDQADALHANYWLSGVAGHRIKHTLDLPLVSTFHTLDRVKAEVDEAESQLRAHAEADVVACSDGLLASCTEEAKQLIRLYGADPARIEIVAPGVDHAFFAPGDRAQARRALALPDGPMLLFVGRIQPLKSADVAVNTLAEVAAVDRRAFLVIIGGPSGPSGDAELARLHALVDEHGLHDRVRFVPPQRHELLSSWYRAADVCLIPSRSESFGLVALEAAACGAPVVAAAVGGLTTLVHDGRTGFLVETRDPSRYAARVRELLADPSLASAMGAAAAAEARRYTWSIAAARLRRLYSDLTARQLVQCP
jgi:D-inositol-3-phosphate glycosyltransferase